MTSTDYKFELYKANNGQWAWRFKAPNHRIVATGGETYHNKADAINGITLVKQHAPREDGGCKFELFVATNSQWSWRFKASNGLSVAFAGETYHNQSDAQHGINLVKMYAPSARVNELVPA